MAIILFLKIKQNLSILHLCDNLEVEGIIVILEKK